jgi:hypothetical protein
MRWRFIFCGLEDHTHFDPGLGAVLNCLDVSFAEVGRQQVARSGEVLVEVGVIVGLAFRQLPLCPQSGGEFLLTDHFQFAHVILRAFLDGDVQIDGGI